MDVRLYACGIGQKEVRRRFDEIDNVAWMEVKGSEKKEKRNNYNECWFE